MKEIRFRNNILAVVQDGMEKEQIDFSLSHKSMVGIASDAKESDFLVSEWVEPIFEFDLNLVTGEITQIHQNGPEVLVESIEEVVDSVKEFKRTENRYDYDTYSVEKVDIYETKIIGSHKESKLTLWNFENGTWISSQIRGTFESNRRMM